MTNLIRLVTKRIVKLNIRDKKEIISIKKIIGLINKGIPTKV